MPQAVSQKKQMQKSADDLVKLTHFKKFEIESMLNLYKTYTKTKMDRSKFRDVLHNEFLMTDDLLMDRIFKVFDKDNDNYISAAEWVKGLSILLRGTTEEQIIFCFNVYDFNGDGYISRDEMFALLKKSVVRQSNDEDPDEGIKDLVEIALRKLDQDGDHRVSLKDFQEAIAKEGLLLQAFGACLPDIALIEVFMIKYFNIK